jgi:CheY-like chemotaxis protein
VLIVEDDALELGLALRALQSTGTQVEVARDGAEALDRLLPPNVTTLPLLSFVLLDLKLPKVGGLDVVRRLKRDPVSAAIPLVVFSSSAEARDLALCYQAGANSYIVKPVDFDQLLAALAAAAAYWCGINRTRPVLP